jgi:CBS domain-containing protein
MNANEIMTTDVKTCRADSNLEDVSRLMWEFDCGAIPVVNNKNKPIGIVTDRDIAMSAMLNHKPLWEIGVSALTNGQRLCCCLQGDPVEDCLVKMEQNGVRRILVVGEDGRLAGILSMGDAVAFANKSKTNRKNVRGIPAENLLAMLQHVSSHHNSAKKPLTVARASQQN